MDKLFEQYAKKYDALYNKLREKTPRPLRLFDIKLRLALGIQIDFDSETAQTKTPLVKDCYVHLIKLVELWNAYEAFVQYAKTQYPAHGKNGEKDKKFALIEAIDPQNTAEPLRKGFDTLIKLHEDKRFAEDFYIFKTKVKEQSAIKPYYKNRLEEITAHLKKKTPNGNDTLMRLIYIERNLFDHSGEAVKMGMDYRNRKKLLTLYYDALRKYVLNAINSLL
jgi:hypothetical protein